MSAPALAWDSAARGQPFERCVVIHVAVHDLAAMAVAGVLAIANIGDDQQFGHGFFDRTHGALHDSVVVVCARRLFVLRLGQPEEDDSADSERVDLLAFFDEFVDRKLIVAGHRGDLAPYAFPGADEKRKNELRRVEAGSRGPGRAWTHWNADGVGGEWERALIEFYRGVPHH